VITLGARGRDRQPWPSLRGGVGDPVGPLLTGRPERDRALVIAIAAGAAATGAATRWGLR
jgi:hypothetical protein